MQKLSLNINICASVKPLTLMKKERAQTSVLWKLKFCMRKGLCKKIISFLLDWYIWKEKSTTNKTLKSHEYLFRSEIQAPIVKDLLNSINSALHRNPYWKVRGICIKIWWEITSSDLFFLLYPDKAVQPTEPAMLLPYHRPWTGWLVTFLHRFHTPIQLSLMRSYASSSVLLPVGCSESIRRHSTQFCAKTKALALLDLCQHLHKTNGIGSSCIALPLKYLAAQSRHMSKINRTIILFLFKSLLLISHV